MAKPTPVGCLNWSQAAGPPRVNATKAVDTCEVDLLSSRRRGPRWAAAGRTVSVTVTAGGLRAARHRALRPSESGRSDAVALWRRPLRLGELALLPGRDDAERYRSDDGHIARHRDRLPQRGARARHRQHLDRAGAARLADFGPVVEEPFQPARLLRHSQQRRRSSSLVDRLGAAGALVAAKVPQDRAIPSPSPAAGP